MMKTFRTLMLSALLGLTCVASVLAQTAVNATTLSAAITNTQTTVTVASASTMAVGDVVFVDREAMKIVSLSSTTLRVIRAQQGTAGMAHASAALVYSGTPDRFGTTQPSGACTRSAEQFLPRILPALGQVWDCPVGTGTWSLINAQGLRTAKSVWFNLDNGAGTTIDDVLVRATRPIRIVACRAVYVDATTGTVAAGTFSVGTTVGGVDIVIATAYENTKAVGTSTAGVIVAGAVAANSAVFVRHTGVATTAAGQAYIECDYQVQ